MKCDSQEWENQQEEGPSYPTFSSASGYKLLTRGAVYKPTLPCHHTL